MYGLCSGAMHFFFLRKKKDSDFLTGRKMLP